MNTRRALFSLFAAAPIGAVAALSLKPVPDEVIRSSRDKRCSCGSHIYHFADAKPVCSWCGAGRDDSH